MTKRSTSCSRSDSRFGRATNGIESLIAKHTGATVAIVGTGTSLDGYDFGELERGDGKIWTLGINGAVRLLKPDYAICCDPRAFSRNWRYYDPETTFILGRRVWNAGRRRPEWLPDSEETSAGRLAKLRVHVCSFAPDRGETPIGQWLFFTVATLTSALTLADAMGFSTTLLLGVDLYRRRDRVYALNLDPAPPDTLEEIPGAPGLYLTPQLRAQRDAVESSSDRWGFDRVVNLSRYSQLRCWPIDRELSLPRDPTQPTRSPH